MSLRAQLSIQSLSNVIEVMNDIVEVVVDFHCQVLCCFHVDVHLTEGEVSD